MTSSYLTEESTEATRTRLLKRIASEARPDRRGQPRWDVLSDYWQLPQSEQLEVLAIVYESGEYEE